MLWPGMFSTTALLKSQGDFLPSHSDGIDERVVVSRVEA